MADEYTPSMASFRMAWTELRWDQMGQRSDLIEAEFDRALAAHDAEIRRDQAEKDAAIAQRRIDVGHAGHPIITAEFPDNGQQIAAAIRAQFATEADCGARNPRTGWICDAHRGEKHRMLLPDGDVYDWLDD